jgi:hypothetical protein
MLAWVRMTRLDRAPAAAPMAAGRASAAWLALAVAAGVLGSCLPQPQRMCTAATDCGGGSSACVAGRCIAGGAVPAISTARRVVYEPVDVGYVRRDGDSSGVPGAAALATLGLSSAPRMFLRFDVSLRPDDDLVEAFLAIERASEVAADPTAITLHAAGVVDRWDGRRLSWGSQPRIEEFGLPQTPVSPAAGARVRLDVRGLLERLRRRHAGDVSLAVLSDGESATGVTFAMTPGRLRGPELELYLR